jgi:transcriptional regulator
LLLDAQRGEYGTLLGHFARANPQWQADHAQAKTLALFHGPHAYVSPSWYPDGKLAVPTWNYSAVHATGIIRLIEEPDEAQAVVERLAETYESSRAAPWKNQLPADLNRKMMNGIVVFEMPIQRLEGKFKLSQNRSEADQQGAIAGLRQAGDEESVALAAFAETHLKKPQSG